jgi:hypothetical protein
MWTFPDDAIRAQLTIDEAGDAMVAVWERATDVSWAHWMDMRFTRLPPR